MKNASAIVKARKVEFGDGAIKICLPVVGRSRQDILEQCASVVSYQPDVIEFRADWYDALEDLEQLTELLGEIRDIISDTALLFTIRTAKEGGEKAISWENYVTVNMQAARSGFVDLVDVEAFFNLSAEQLAKTLPSR